MKTVHSNLVRLFRHTLVVQTIDEGSNVVCTAHLLLRDNGKLKGRTGLLGYFFAKTSSVSIPLSASLRIWGATR